MSIRIFYRKLNANIEAVHSAIEHDQAMKKERHKRENVYTNSDDLQIELKHSRGTIIIVFLRSCVNFQRRGRHQNKYYFTT